MGTQRCTAAQEASKCHLIELKTWATMEQARNLLQLAKNRRNEFDAVDVVVTELHLRHERQVGLEILQIVDSLWSVSASDFEARPLFVLLTPNRDKEVSDVVRSHRCTAMVRCDRPEAIIQTVVEARCKAATLPEVSSLRRESL